ncbi:MAG: hypothetical protein ABI162_08425 [Luteolibacter sp.]
MKSIFNACGAVTLGCLLPLAAQNSQTTTQSEVTRNADGSVTHTESTKTVTFNPEVRTKVVHYFDAYKSDPLGLPPGFATRIKVKEIPAAWRTTTIAPGVVVSENERSYLVDAPPELVKVLPASSADVHYYIAGSNVVAVDKSYRIVDSIQIPSIRFTTDEPDHVEKVERHMKDEDKDDDD